MHHCNRGEHGTGSHRNPNISQYWSPLLLMATSSPVLVPLSLWPEAAAPDDDSCAHRNSGINTSSTAFRTELQEISIAIGLLYKHAIAVVS